ncbi:MAG TPA: hypothetical protein DCR31_03495 [Ruminococcaceae bacterium]|nr:hypothetical protein [Oscillospiraceae bacterium]
MLDLFDQNGHLTDEALQALIWEDDLDDLQRLEIAEHLSFCDACTDRYTNILCDDVLQSPPVPMYGEVMQQIRKKERKMFLRRLTTISAAACLALVFWWSGVFEFPSREIDRNHKPEQSMQTDWKEQRPSGMEEIRTGLQQFTSGFGKWTQSFLEPLDKAFSKTYEKENSHGEK